MNKGRALLLCVLTFGYFISQAQNTEDEYESAVSQCVRLKFQLQNCDFDKTITAYEAYLIRKGYLEDSTGDAYVKVFEMIADSNKISFFNDFDFPVLEEQYRSYVTCFYKQKELLRLYDINSTLQELYKEFDTIQKRGGMTISDVAKSVLKIIDSAEFEKRIYRDYALVAFYMNSYLNSSRLPEVNYEYDIYLEKDSVVWNEQLLCYRLLKKNLRKGLKHKSGASLANEKCLLRYKGVWGSEKAIRIEKLMRRRDWKNFIYREIKENGDKS